MVRSILCVSLLLMMSGAAQAALTFDADVSPSKANGTFISGTGIPGDGFVIDTGANDLSVALKARARVGGQPLSSSNFDYTVLKGLAPSSSSPWWSFDFQYSPGTSGLAMEETIMTLEVDFNPASSVANFVTISLPLSDIDPPATPDAWNEVHPDGFFTNPGSNGWSNNDVPFVYSQSWHLNFGFWDTLGASPDYNPNTLGEYEIRMSVATTAAPTTFLASTSMFVTVVPEPGSLVLMGIGLVGLLARHRRRR